MEYDHWEWSSVRPSEYRKWHRHQYGIRCDAWVCAGHFQRTYYIDPLHLSPDLQRWLPQTVAAIVEVIKAELTAAIKAQVLTHPTNQEPTHE